MSDSTPAASTPWLTLGGAVAIVLILLLIGILLTPTALGRHKDFEMTQRGMQMYKGIFADALDNPEVGYSFFPARTNGYVSSTHYFQDLMDRDVLRVPSSTFSGPGLARPADKTPTTLVPSQNAWSVILDVQDQIASTPFLLSRNFLADRIRLPGKDESLTPDLFAEFNACRKLRFDGEVAVIITKAGTGFFLKVEKLGAGSRAEVFNPGDHRGLILRP